MMNLKFIVLLFLNLSNDISTMNSFGCIIFYKRILDFYLIIVVFYTFLILNFSDSLHWITTLLNSKACLNFYKFFDHLK